MHHLQPFHLAIPVKELNETRRFYNTILNCEEGRSSDKWVDFNFYGHQLVLHIAEQQDKTNSNPVDGHDVPVPHFGVVLTMEDWNNLAERLKEQKIEFIIEPYIRFEGEPGEQATMFFKDPSGNALEFKAFQNLDQLFAK
ncbi:MAG: VOC family protein [Ginsengibacter sp.]